MAVGKPELRSVSNAEFLFFTTPISLPPQTSGSPQRGLSKSVRYSSVHSLLEEWNSEPRSSLCGHSSSYEWTICHNVAELQSVLKYTLSIWLRDWIYGKINNKLQSTGLKKESLEINLLFEDFLHNHFLQMLVIPVW